MDMDGRRPFGLTYSSVTRRVNVLKNKLENKNNLKPIEDRARNWPQAHADVHKL